MKTRLTPFILALAFMVVPVAAHAQGKIGVINFSAAIANTAEGKKGLAELKNKFMPRRQELERMQQEILGIQDKLNKASPTMSDDEQRRLSRDLEEKQKQLKRSTDDAQSDYNADTDESVRRIGQKMVRIISDYAQKNGFVLIIDDAQIPIYYAAKDLDISAECIKRYDAAYPVADTGTAPSPAAPKP